MLEATLAFASPTMDFGCTRTPISSSVSASTSRRRLMSASICAGVLVSDVFDVSATARPPKSAGTCAGQSVSSRAECTVRTPGYASSMSERLQPGDVAPAFALPDADGNEVSLSAHKGRKVIVYFYPAALTPGC